MTARPTVRAGVVIEGAGAGLQMLYDDLADIHSDLAWALLELRLKLPARTGETDKDEAILRAEAALERLSAIIAVIAEVTKQKERPRAEQPPRPPPERRH